MSSPEIRTMKIKTTFKFHLTPVGIAKINKTIDNRFWKSAGKGNPHSTVGGISN